MLLLCEKRKMLVKSAVVKKKKSKRGVRVRVDKVCRLVGCLVDPKPKHNLKKDKKNSPLPMNECQQKSC